MNLLRPGASILGAKRLKRLVPKEFVIRENDVLVAGFVTVKMSEIGWKHTDASLGGAPYDGAYTGKLRPKGVPFSGFRYHKRVGIPLVDVCIRVGKSVIWVCERAQNGYQMVAIISLGLYSVGM